MTEVTITHLISCSNRMVQLLCLLLLVALMLLGIEIYSFASNTMNQSIKSAVTIVMMLLLCSGLYFIKFLGLRRMCAITSTAEDIMRTGDLSKRIPIDSRWEDLSNLSSTLNNMLSEIEQLVGGVRTVSDNIAHDLRTPLTRLRNHIEEMRVTATACPTIEDQQRQYSNLVMECDEMLATFQALLRISNIESGRKHAVFLPFNVSAVLNDVIELYEPVAAEKNIVIASNLEPSVTLNGDKDLMFQAFANLIDNAMKYTPSGGHVAMDLQSTADGIHFQLRDNGLGINDTHKSLVFQRFYRVEASRHLPGYGLGLSLVSAIIALHKGRIILSDNAPSGLVVTIKI
jgi:signal transduction histidine kinase